MTRNLLLPFCVCLFATAATCRADAQEGSTQQRPVPQPANGASWSEPIGDDPPKAKPPKAPAKKPAESLTFKERIELRRAAKANSFRIEVKFSDGTGGSGSGVLLKRFSKAGLILTNAHVVRHRGLLPSKITVESGKEKGFKSTGLLAYYSKDSRNGLDLALIAVGDDKNLLGSPPRIAQSVSVGQHVTHVGNPLGERFLVSEGTVRRPYLPAKGSFVQTATSERGSSGGGVFNSKGELLGLITQGIGESQKERESVFFGAQHMLARLRIHYLRVNANQGWQDSGVLIESPSRVHLLAAGNVTLGSFTRKVPPFGVKGRAKYSLFPQTPHGCVLAQIGTRGAPSALLSAWKGAGPSNSSLAILNHKGQRGGLRLRLNDTTLKNNSGSFAVVVVVER